MSKLDIDPKLVVRLRNLADQIEAGAPISLFLTAHSADSDIGVWSYRHEDAFEASKFVRLVQNCSCNLSRELLQKSYSGGADQDEQDSNSDE